MPPDSLSLVPPLKVKVDLSGGNDNYSFTPDSDDPEEMKAAKVIAGLQLLQAEHPTMMASNCLDGKAVKISTDKKTGAMRVSYTNKN